MKVFIIGSGTMGTGIAQVLSASSSVSELTVFVRNDEKGLKLKENCNRNLKKFMNDLFLKSIILNSFI